MLIWCSSSWCCCCCCCCCEDDGKEGAEMAIPTLFFFRLVELGPGPLSKTDCISLSMFFPLLPSLRFEVVLTRPPERECMRVRVCACVRAMTKLKLCPPPQSPSISLLSLVFKSLDSISIYLLFVFSSPSFPIRPG